MRAHLTRAVAMVAVLAVAAAACTSQGATPKPVAASGGWSRVALGRRAPEASAQVASLTRVNVNNKGLWLALGTTSDSPGALQKPGAWASQDDSNWQGIAMPIDASDAGSVVVAASDGTKGLAGGAVGTGRSSVPAVWTSADAWSWIGPQKLPVPPDARGATVRAISHGPGGWVAAGGQTADGDAPPLFWFSPDGESWTLVDAGPLPRAHSGWSVAASADRYVAIVSANDLERRDEQNGLVVLSSTDGKTWQSQVLDGFDRAVVSRSVVRVRDLFVAAVDCCQLDGQPRLAVSRDGTTWSPGLSLPGLVEGFAVTTLTEREGRLVAWAGAGSDVGARQTSAEQDLGLAAVPPEVAWESITLPETPRGSPYSTAPTGYGTTRLAAAGLGIVLLRPTTTKAYLFWSFGDGQWGTALSDVPPPERQWSETVNSMAGTDVVVAVGRADYLALPGRTARPAEGRIWVSSGPLAAWEEVIVNGNIDDLRGVATDGQRFVAVGTKGARPLVLASKTGRAWEEITATADSPLSLLGDPDATEPTTPSDGAAAPLPDGELPTSIVRFGDRFVVRTEPGHLWSSSDGGRWQQVSLPEGPAAQELCASADLVLASPYRSTDGARWTVDPAVAAAAFDVRSCAVSPSGDAVLVGSDQRSYAVLRGDQVEVRPFPLGTLFGAAWAGRWLLVGSAGEHPDGDPALWESTDAQDWRARSAAVDLGREAGAGSLSTALAGRDRLVLGGTHNDAALVVAGPATG